MKRSKILTPLTGLCLVFVLTWSCADHEVGSTVDCSGTGVTFAEVNSVIQTSCATNSGCHGSRSNNRPGAR